MSRFLPTSIDELRDAVADALAAAEPVEIVAGGSKRGLGRPLQVPRTLDLSRLAGIRDHQPNELVLTAGPATRLAEIESVLGKAGQTLAFEPPDWDGLLGLPETDRGHRTLGGVIAGNLSGPRRIRAGAARDHFLGFRAVSGRGEVFKAGGKVVKNVTGYDLPKLLAGSWGTLAALEEVTVKVLPRPEETATVVLNGLDPEAASRAMSRALGSPHEVSAAAYLPAGLAAAPTLTLPRERGREGWGLAALRLEGPASSVAFRRDRLLSELSAEGDSATLDDSESELFWRAIRDAEPLLAFPERAVWRISVPPARGAAFGEEIGRALDAAWYLDWGGGLVWAAVADAEDGGAAAIRTMIRGEDGGGAGHATLIRGAPALRRVVPVFEPQPAGLMALSARIKSGFDPHRILNPGRMWAGI